MKKHWLWLALALAAFLLITYVVQPSQDLGPEALAALCVAVFAVVVWMTQAGSAALSGFMFVLLLAVSGADDGSPGFVLLAKGPGTDLSTEHAAVKSVLDSLEMP